MSQSSLSLKSFCKKNKVKLSKDIMWDVVKKVAENPSFPLEVLMAYANQDEKKIRLAVQNPSFPLPKLLELAQAACYYPKFYPTDAIIRALLNRYNLLNSILSRK